MRRFDRTHAADTHQRAKGRLHDQLQAMTVPWRAAAVALVLAASTLSASPQAQLPQPGTAAWDQLRQAEDDQWARAALLRFVYVSQVLAQEAPDAYAEYKEARESHDAATAELLLAIPDVDFFRAYGAPMAGAEDLLFDTYWLSLIGPFAMSQGAAMSLYGSALEWETAAAELRRQGMRAAPERFLRYQETGLDQLRALVALKDQAPDTFAEWNFVAHVLRRAQGYPDIPVR